MGQEVEQTGADTAAKELAESLPSARPPRPRSRGNILVVDDEVFIRKAFELFFDTIGFNVRVADGGEAALRVFQSEDFAVDVILLDLVMPGVHGLELLRTFKEEKPDVEVIIATGCGSLSSAIEAMRNGAFDYITKPIVNFEEELLKVVEDAILHRRNRLRSRTTVDYRGFQGNSEFAYHNLALFEKFLKLADIAAVWRADEKGRDSAWSALTGVQEALDAEFGISSGLLLVRSGEEFEARHHWGHVRPTPLRKEWFASLDQFRDVLQGRVFVFPTEDLRGDLLEDVPDALEESPMAIHLPLVLEGVHRGSLFLFFTKRAEELKNADFLDNGHPYLVLAPMLASVFLGATAGQ